MQAIRITSSTAKLPPSYLHGFLQMVMQRSLLILLLFLSNTLNAQRCEHIVQRGEDFESIASRYAITVEELKSANPESKTCYAGRKLLIPFHGVEVKRKPVEVPEYDYGLISSTDSILTHSAATTFQVGYANWKKRKFDKAFIYLFSAAEQGESRAYYPLGDCYTQEVLASHDDQIAVQWFQKASDKAKDKTSHDYYMSCLRLADCYANGKGVSKDIAQARYYYKQYSKYTQEKNNKLAAQTQSVIKREEEAIAQAERDKKVQEQRKREEAYLAKARQQQGNGVNSKTASSTAALSSPAQQASSRQFSGAYTFETTGYWGHKQTLYVQQPVYLSALDKYHDTELYFSSEHCSVIKVLITYSLLTDPVMLSNPFIANMYNKWSVYISVSKGIYPACWGLSNYTYENGYFKLPFSNGITYWLAQDLSSFVVNIGNTRYNYRISKEQYEQLRQIESDFLNKADAYEAQYLNRSTSFNNSSSSSNSSSVSKSIQEAIDECDRNIDAINHRSVERYKTEANKKSNYIYYAPDYTGGKYTYWCTKCGKWGSNHVHYEK